MRFRGYTESHFLQISFATEFFDRCEIPQKASVFFNFSRELTFHREKMFQPIPAPGGTYLTRKFYGQNFNKCFKRRFCRLMDEQLSAARTLAGEFEQYINLSE